MATTLRKARKVVASQQTAQRSTVLRRISRYRIAYAFIAPAVLAMLLVHIIPSVQAIWLSFLDLRTATLLQYLRAPFVGLLHYERILGGLMGLTKY